jgi:threonine dehydrogenase-like Zn-dependent dehydrogenase
VQIEGSICGICAWDIHTFQHGTGGPFAAPPGHEGVGYIKKLGPNVSGFQGGDRVVSYGGFSGLYNIRTEYVYHLPPSDLPDQYWLVEPASCVVTGIDHCNLHAGDRVAVVGCGFMGLMLVQCLAHSLADEIIALDVNAQRLQMAGDLGATRMLDPADKSFDEEFKGLQKLQIDTVVDASGAQAGLDVSTKIVKRGGRINLFGWIHGQATFSGDQWHMGGYTIVCSSPSAKVRDTFPSAIRLIEKGIIDMKPLVTHVVPLDEMSNLLSRVVNGKERDYIKGVIKLR